jgi:hypothetical protein
MDRMAQLGQRQTTGWEPRLDSRKEHEIFQYPTAFLRPHYARSFTQPLTEMGTRDRNKNFWRVGRGRSLVLIIWTTPLSRLSRQCAILNISQPYGLPWPVTGITLIFLLRLGSYLTGNTDRPPQPVAEIALDFTLLSTASRPERGLR